MTMHTFKNIDSVLWAKVKACAALRQVTLQAFIVELLEREVEKCLSEFLEKKGNDHEKK